MGPPSGNNALPPNKTTNINRYPPQNQYTNTSPSQPEQQTPYYQPPQPEQQTPYYQPPQDEYRSVRPRPPPQPHQMVPGSFIQQPQTTHPHFSPDDLDEEDGRPGSHQVNVNVQYQESQVNQSTSSIFTSFMVNRMDNDGYDVPSHLQRRPVNNNEK